MNTKFIIAAGSALPDELKQYPLVSGSLVERLAAFVNAPAAILPLTDVEINGISKAIEVLPISDALVITGLPGSFSSAIFDAAVASAGFDIRTWDEVAAQMRATATESQRTRDRSPWTVKAAPLAEPDAAGNAVEDDDSGQ